MRKKKMNSGGTISGQAVAARLKRSAQRARVTLWSLSAGLFVLAAATGIVDSTRRMILVVLGFSAIIFVHELGHFIVARLCSVRCDVFSIGIGPRMMGWKKGVGFSFGNEPDIKKDPAHPSDHPDNLAAGLGSLSDMPQEASVPDEAPQFERKERAALRNRLTDVPLPSAIRGTTDYRISWAPLGGYVRMLGQDDMDPTKVSSDPHAFNNRPIWQRMCIVSAGVIMNVITAAVIFAAVFRIGIEFPPAYIGNVDYDSPAWNATYALHGKMERGLQPGDQIVAIDGKKPSEGFLEFTDVMISSALSTGTSPVTYTIQRPGEPQPFDVSLTPKESKDSSLLSIGVQPAKAMQTAELTDQDKLDAQREGSNIALFDSRDTLISFNGQALDGIAAPQRYPFILNQLQESKGHAVTVQVRSTAGKVRDVTLTPELLNRSDDVAATLLGFYPPVMLRDVLPKSVAEGAGLKPGDVICRIGAIEWPTLPEFVQSTHDNAGQSLSIDVMRNGKRVTIDKVVPALKSGVGLIGVAPQEDFDHAVIAGIDPDSSVASLKLIGGTQITAINGQTVHSWKDIFAIVRELPTGDVHVQVVPPENAGAMRELTVALNDVEKKNLEKYNFVLGILLENYTAIQKADTLGGAVQMGLAHTESFILQTYATLYGLFNRTVPPDQLHGIIGIGKIGHDIQDRGFLWLLYILGMVSVNLAVANFLPLPIVDGGLFLLLIVEKIRGKPLPLKVQSAIQVVGLCLLGAMFLFVTKNDIGMFFK
jgi:regulator of sigma E protease